MEILIKNENEFMGKDYHNILPQKTEEYLEFVSFLLEAEEWGNEIIVIKSEIWDKFYETDKWKFETYFVSAKYIDEWTYNTIELTVNINGINQRFIIDVV